MDRSEKLALGVVLFLILGFLLVSCDRHTTTVVSSPAAPVVAAPAPVVVQQPSHDGFFTGMLMGHMMSGGFLSQPTQQNVTVNKTVTVVRPTTTATYRPAPPNYRPMASVSRSYSTGRR